MLLFQGIYVVRYRIDSELVVIPAVRHQKEVGY